MPSFLSDTTRKPRIRFHSAWKAIQQHRGADYRTGGHNPEVPVDEDQADPGLPRPAEFSENLNSPLGTGNGAVIGRDESSLQANAN